MDRSVWTPDFRRSQLLKWPCPKCAASSALTIEDHAFFQAEMPSSIEAHSHIAWEPSWIQGRFAALLKCRNCEEPVAVSGSYTVDEFFDPDDQDVEYEERFTVKSVITAPRMIYIPGHTPAEVCTELEAAFQLYWVDANASGARIRSAVERLLDALGIAKTTVNKLRKRVRISLHDRIVSYRAKNPSLAKSLEAAKWIGNAGSHDMTLTREDILDGLEILEHVFSELYDERSKKIGTIVRQVNRRKSPRSSHVRSPKLF